MGSQSCGRVPTFGIYSPYFFDPVPQECLCWILVSFWLYFGSILIVSETFLVPFRHRKLFLSAPESVNDLQAWSGTCRRQLMYIYIYICIYTYIYIYIYIFPKFQTRCWWCFVYLFICFHFPSILNNINFLARVPLWSFLASLGTILVMLCVPFGYNLGPFGQPFVIFGFLFWPFRLPGLSGPTY